MLQQHFLSSCHVNDTLQEKMWWFLVPERVFLPLKIVMLANKIWSAIAADMADPLQTENNTFKANVTRNLILYRN